MAVQSSKYICTVCKKEVDSVNFLNVMACPYCSSKIFTKKSNSKKREIKCI